jgi:hypothetical protein
LRRKHNGGALHGSALPHRHGLDHGSPLPLPVRSTGRATTPLTQSV